MCGIVIFDSKKIDTSLKKNFIKSLRFLKHRGPDKTFFLKNKSSLIGFNRLSINNISNGHQPYESECGNYSVVFNGEIFNYKELEVYLNEKGINTNNASEAEIIIAFYKLYGESCLKFFRGFFAIVIYNKKKKKYFVAVDRLGIKQIYYHYSKKKNLLILTSDYSHLAKINILELKIDKEALMNFVCLGRIFGKQTIYKEIFRLEPGFKLNYDQKSGLRIKRYWSNFKKKNSINLSNKNFENLNSIHLSANQLWQRSEVKISNTLSTGTDSNFINYGFLKNNIRNVKFSILESNKNKKIKKYYNEKINLKLIFKELTNFAKHNKNPLALANSSCGCLFQIYRNIKKKKIKVVFTGEGGDEIFGGYARYKRQLNLLKKKKLNFSDHVIQLYKREINLFNKFNNYYKIEDIKKKFKSNLKKIKLNSQSYQNNILEFDQLTWLPMLLIKHDLIGMHYSLEVRPQILDHKIVEYVNNFIPSKLKFNKNYNKIFLKKFLIKFNKFRVKRKKGSPSISEQILLNKKYLEIFKNTLKNSLFLKKYFNAELFKNDAIYNSENMIFLWRLFIVSLMFSYKR